MNVTYNNSLAAGDVYLVRHGATDWSKSGRHTGRTDLSLDEDGVEAAKSLKTKLGHIEFKYVFTSPLKRAVTTCELAGYGTKAIRNDDLMEWDYGDYEGLTKSEIQNIEPGWDVYDHGAKGGEAPMQVVKRCQSFLTEIKDLEKPIAVFSHSHLLRSLATVFIDTDIKFAQKIQMDTARVSVLAKSPLGGMIISWNV